MALWRKVATVEDPTWTARYHDPDPNQRAFGGRIEITLTDGRCIVREKKVADAHPNGAAPWAWRDYVGKFDMLAGPLTGAPERDRFIADCEHLRSLSQDAVRQLNPVFHDARVVVAEMTGAGIFDHGSGA